MLAHAFLAVATAAERDTQPTPAGLIPLTVNEFRRLFDALLLAAEPHLATPARLVHLAPTTPSPSPRHATTADATNTNDHELRLQY